MNLLLAVGGGFLLLVVGTLLGRYYAPDRRPLKQAAAEGRSYIRGLVEVLEGNPDAAIAELVRAVRQNSAGVEPYFALGALFRQRKEYERAVRVHQALLLRRDIDRGERLRVHRQLALDFVAAGFPLRAIQALEWVVAQDRRQGPVWRELALLYEGTEQWERAALAWAKVGRYTDEDVARRRAHLWAELAFQRLEAGELDGARTALRQAASADGEAVHVLHVMALFQERRDNPRAAARAWERALERAPELAGFFFSHLERVRLAQGKAHLALDRVQALQRERPQSVPLRLTLARLEARQSPLRALRLLEELLQDHPTLLPAQREAALIAQREGDEQAVRRALRRLLALLERADRAYRCDTCGRSNEDLFWRCPHCQAWGTVTAI